MGGEKTKMKKGTVLPAHCISSREGRERGESLNNVTPG